MTPPAPTGLDIRSMRLVMPGDSSRIPVEAGVSQYESPDALNRKMTNDKTTARFSGIFDTGASATVISERLAAALLLKKIDKVPVQTANGESEQYVHAVNISFPNGIIFPGIRVTAAPLCGIDILIGMDIISHGDFTVSRKHGFLVADFHVYIPIYQEPNNPIAPNLV